MLYIFCYITSSIINKPKIDYHGLSRTVMAAIDCPGLSWTIIDYHRLSWTIMDYPRLIKVADLSYFYILFTD